MSKKKQAARQKPERILYVEGGGDHNSILGSQCRKAFSKLFEKAEVIDRPTVRPKGGREQAFRAFCKELAIGKNHIWLLVDAEELAPALKPGETANPWAHVKARDQWDKPSGANDEQLHLMSVMMETWLVCDREALRKQCSQINATKLPAVNRSLESKSKEAINKALDDAFSSTSAKKYSKGSHSFKILAEVDPMKLRRSLFWADRFLLEMGAPIIQEGSASRKPEPVAAP